MENENIILNTIVIGNGFDLDLKYETKYSDFVKSTEWKELYLKRSEENPKNSLIQFLNGKLYIEEWFDIELSLLEYVSRKKDGSFVNNAFEDKKDYELICRTLELYLKRIINETALSFDNTCAEQVLKKYLENCHFNSNSLYSFYSFNYTPVDFYARMYRDIEALNMKIEYIHGECFKNSSILGFEVDDIKEIAPGYSFMIKSNNPNYKTSKISLDMMNSREVIFFGHSFNNIDIGYFSDYFSMMEKNTEKEKRITIITYDENSKLALFDNLRKSGISIQKLFTHSDVKVIKTTIVENNRESEDFKEFEDLLNRM